MLIGTNDLTNPTYNLVMPPCAALPIAPCDSSLPNSLSMNPRACLFVLDGRCMQTGIFPDLGISGMTSESVVFSLQDIQDPEGTSAVVAAGVLASVALILQQCADAHIILLAIMPRGERCAPPHSSALTRLSRRQLHSACCLECFLWWW